MRALPLFRRRSVRRAATAVVVVALVVSAWIGGRQSDTLRSERDTAAGAADTNARSVDKAGAILADVCKVAPDKTLKAAGRDRECQLAEAGRIDQVVPVVTPQIRVERVSPKDIEKAVDAYLDDYLTDLPSLYRSDLRRAVVAYLTDNPPAAGKDGKPGAPATQAMVLAAVVDYLQKHPPAPGKDGAPGVSVAAVALDGCELVFTFSDQSTSRVGPVCGAKGAKGDGPTADELRAAFDSYCADQPGGTCKGTAASPGYPTGWRQSDGSVCTDPDGDRFYTCESPPPATTEPPVVTPPVTLPTG